MYAIPCYSMPHMLQMVACNSVHSKLNKIKQNEIKYKNYDDNDDDDKCEMLHVTTSRPASQLASQPKPTSQLLIKIAIHMHTSVTLKFIWKILLFHYRYSLSALFSGFFVSYYRLIIIFVVFFFFLFCFLLLYIIAHSFGTRSSKSLTANSFQTKFCLKHCKTVSFCLHARSYYLMRQTTKTKKKTKENLIR